MTRKHVGLLALAAFACGCAPRRPTAAAQAGADRSVAAPSAADSARCAAVADSVRAATAPEVLPIAVPAGQPRMPRPPRDAAPNVPLRTTFLVGPDGRAVTATVSVSGTSDADYREAMVRLLTETRFRPVTVDGCPSWGRGDFMMVGVPQGRVRVPQGGRPR